MAEYDLRTDSGREQMIFGEQLDWQDVHGIARFGVGNYTQSGPITPDTAEQLIESGYMDPDTSQNFAPEHSKIVMTANRLQNQHPEIEVLFGGYVIPERRPDARVSITSVRMHTNNGYGESVEDARETFAAVFGNADEYHEDGDMLYAWWD